MKTQGPNASQLSPVRGVIEGVDGPPVLLGDLVTPCPQSVCPAAVAMFQVAADEANFHRMRAYARNTVRGSRRTQQKGAGFRRPLCGVSAPTCLGVEVEVELVGVRA